MQTEFRVQLVEEPIARQWNEYYELESLPHDVVEAISSQEKVLILLHSSSFGMSLTSWIKTKSRPLTEIRKVSSLVKHTGPVNCVRWNRPNGNLLVSASMDRSAFIWDPLRSKKVVYSINNFSGMQLVSIESQLCSFLSLLLPNTNSGGVKDAQWSYDGNQLIFGGYECTSRLFDVGKQAISRVRSYFHH
jgi:WD40 repeat protein